VAEREVHLRDYFAIIRRHSFIVIASFLLISGSALIVSLYMPRIYEATTTMEVQPTSSSSGLSSLMQNVISRGVDQISMETICRRFTSRTLLAETIRNLRKRIPEMNDYLESPEALLPKIRANSVPDTRMIEVSVRMGRSEGGSQSAARIANELVSVMQLSRSEKTDAEMKKRREFINSKLAEAMSRIAESDDRMMEFVKSSGDTLVWSTRAEYLMARLADLVKLKEESRALLVAEQKKLEELESRRNAEPEWIEYSKTYSQDPLWSKSRSDLLELREQLAGKQSELGEKNREVMMLEAQIRAIEKEMEDIAREAMLPASRTESRNLTYQTLVDQIVQAELNLIAYEAQSEIADQKLEELNRERDQMFSEMPENQFQLEKMRRELEYEVNAYKALMEKKLEAEIWASESSGDNIHRIKGGIEIVDVAQSGSRPVSPRIKFIGAIAGLVGLVVGLAMAFLSEYFENTYQSPEEAKEDLDMPLLGIVPLLKEHQSGAVMLPVVESPMSAEAESFRTIITNIEFSSTETPYSALLITSSGANEGKSFVAANLAVAMAQNKDRVILVDCDMRKAIQHSIFGLGNQAGLANLLVGNAELESVIQDTDIPNLKLLSCGPTPPNPVELLKSQKMDEILSKLRAAYDVLLLDSPPVLPVADSLILASKLDGVLLVADLDHAPREVIRQAQEQLSKLDIPLLGLICNKVGASKSNPYYRQ
jgi:succinoglycan biosynthesis transport protein ExoP